VLSPSDTSGSIFASFTYPIVGSKFVTQEKESKMDQVMEFGKKYGLWIAGAVAAGVATVVVTKIMKSDDDDGEYIVINGDDASNED
jgi:hypothetical protein